MSISKMLLLTGSFLGTTGIILGALGAHALQKILSPEKLTSFQTGVKYQMLHALFILWLWAVEEKIAMPWLKWIFLTTAIGTICFSGSIYILIFQKIKPLVLITPFGGFLMILGWLLLFLYPFFMKVN